MIKILLLIYLISCLIYYIGVNIVVSCINHEEVYNSIEMSIEYNYPKLTMEDVELVLSSTLLVFIPLFNLVAGLIFIYKFFPIWIIIKLGGIN